MNKLLLITCMGLLGGMVEVNAASAEVEHTQSSHEAAGKVYVNVPPIVKYDEEGHPYRAYGEQRAAVNGGPSERKPAEDGSDYLVFDPVSFGEHKAVAEGDDFLVFDAKS